ncbi:sugar transferase [Pseudomonadota bacterium]
MRETMDNYGGDGGVTMFDSTARRVPPPANQCRVGELSKPAGNPGTNVPNEWPAQRANAPLDAGPRVAPNPISPIEAKLLRCCDVIAAASVMTLVSPLMLLVAIAIRFDSPGPILFSQERVGGGRKLFTIYKFRTMSGGAHENLPDISSLEEPNVQRRDDPRVTRVGKLLRKYSLDELPQLMQVLTGEMSLVGPRPLIKEEVDQFPPGWNRRFAAKSGITGLAQTGGRNDLRLRRAVAMDIVLARKMGIRLYAWVLLRTAWQVVLGRGAM